MHSNAPENSSMDFFSHCKKIMNRMLRKPFMDFKGTLLVVLKTWHFALGSAATVCTLILDQELETHPKGDGADGKNRHFILVLKE